MNKGKLVTDKLLEKHPELVLHLIKYMHEKSIIGKPVKHLNGSRCWTFRGSSDGYGYGLISTSNKDILKGVSFTGKAHRISYMIYNGETHGLKVLHHCDNPICVCPDHLYLGTNGKNGDDASKRFAFVHPVRDTWKTTGLRKRMYRDLFDQFSIQEIADEFGVSYQTVYYYKRRYDLGLNL